MDFVIIKRRGLCDGHTNSYLEPLCGRQLGLQFNNQTCELYIANAYFELIKVGKNGGVGKQLVSRVAGVPFRFTNALDIDQETGVVYFTNSSTRFQIRESQKLVTSGDNTGKFMRYDPVSRRVTVLLRELSFANGVAFSKNRDYVLIAETSRRHILRYWLQGPLATTSEVFAQVPRATDNIKINVKGQLWVGLNNGQIIPSSIDYIITVWLDEQGKILKRRHGNGFMQSTSEMNENKGTLFVESVGLPYFVSSHV